MSFADKYGELVEKEYDNGKSVHIIAKQLNTYPNKVLRCLKKRGKTLRSKSEAQKLALKEGRIEHPTEGKKRPQEVKDRISESVHGYWQDLSDEELAKRSEISKKNWDAMSDSDKNNLRAAALEGMRKAAKEGSKLEKHLVDKLAENGYTVIFHKKGLIPKDDLEVDLYLPDLSVCLEIDGITHFSPVFSQEKLQKHRTADAKKAGLLLGRGFILIRVKHLSKSLTEKNKRDVTNVILNKLEEIKVKKPKKDQRFIELEV